MEVDLGDAEALRQGDPVVHGGLGELAEVEQVGTAVVGPIQGPWTADGRVRQVGGLGDRLLEYLAQLGLRTGDEGCPSPDEAEAWVAGGPERRTGLRYAARIGLQVERQTAGRQRLIGGPLESEGDVDEGQLLDAVARCRNDLDERVAGAWGEAQVGAGAGLGELETQQAVRETCLGGGTALAGLADPRERRGGCGGVVRSRGVGKHGSAAAAVDDDSGRRGGQGHRCLRGRLGGQCQAAEKAHSCA